MDDRYAGMVFLDKREPSEIRVFDTEVSVGSLFRRPRVIHIIQICNK